MRDPCLMLLLAALAALGLCPGLALSNESTDGREWMVYSEDNVAFQLVEDEVELWASSASDSERLAIIDSSGEESRTSLEMPSGSWARMRLTPKGSGDLKLFCIYPTGTVAAVLNSSVKEGRSYTTWIEAGLKGDYELWFVVNGEKSNSVKIRVLEAESTEEGAPMAGSGILSKALGGGPALSYSAAPAAAAAGPSIGLSAGGAKDISSFRENINQSYLPLPSDLTYEGLFYDYYFETGATQECNKLFCPSYSYALSKDPFSGERQYYLSLGLNSGIKDLERKKLNLMVVLDYSGSMGSPFDRYYYDRFGNMVEVDPSGKESSKTKMQIADESVVALLDHLGQDDRLGMVIFSDEAFLLDPLTDMANKNPDRLKSSILGIKETDGTNMEAGMQAGAAQFDRLLPPGGSEYENRIIFLTDAMPNLGETGDLALYRMLQENAERGIYTTFIGIGVDFNSELVESITKIKGANYYSVHSAQEFRQRMDEEFDFMVTPLVFDLRLRLDAPGYQIEKVYGSPEADLATGDLMKVNTLFPSRAEEGAVRGGVILVKLRKLSDQGAIKLSASYEDRDGRRDSDDAEVIMEESASDLYQNNGVRKAILLTRYADLLKNWMIDERTAGKGEKILPSVTLAGGIVVPVELGEWERQSLPLTVSDPYPQLFGQFRDYFQSEAQAIGDGTLSQEEEILKELERPGGADRGR
jgi:Ca-activated chloride channel family protein